MTVISHHLYTEQARPHTGGSDSRTPGLKPCSMDTHIHVLRRWHSSQRCMHITYNGHIRWRFVAISVLIVQGQIAAINLT
jgi:hypothetical protein